MGVPCKIFVKFDLSKDEAEQHDLSRMPQHATRWHQLLWRAETLVAAVWSTNWTGAATECVNSSYYKALRRCHRGPACFVPGQVPALPPGSVGHDGQGLCSLTPKRF